MAAEDPSSRNVQERRPRMRIVPPQLGAIERRTRGDRDAQRWTHGLRTQQRWRLLMLLGNLLLLGVLVGLPFLRGHQRAVETQRAHAALLGCLYGTRVGGELGEHTGEAEYFAAELAHGDRTWPARCSQALNELISEPALFVLPSVKAAEARVREARDILRSELAAVAAYKPGMRMPDRPLRALMLLRSTLRAQQVAAGLNAEQALLPPTFAKRPGLPAPARLPLYAAADATLSLWGDDQNLRVAALDATGLSYLEAQAGRPFTRARLVRSNLLRALLRLDAQSWLVWATAPARCSDRSDACFGKTTRVATTPSPLLELPAARTLAAHLAGRPDRSLAETRTGLLLAARTAGGRVALQEFSLPAGFSVAAELPALSAERSWPKLVDEAVVLSSRDQPLVLGVLRDGPRSQLLQMTASSTVPIATLVEGGPWLSACASEAQAGFAFGDGQHVQVGTLTRTSAGIRAHVWPALPAAIDQVIDRERPNRDRAVNVCKAEGTLVVMREASDQLSAIVCHDLSAPCRKLQIASDVEHFSVLASERGALIAYAGKETAQVRVRSIDSKRMELGPEHIPAACWSKSGLCSTPTLSRVGRRIVLVAPDQTDLLALESADEGESFHTPAIL